MEIKKEKIVSDCCRENVIQIKSHDEKGYYKCVKCGRKCQPLSITVKKGDL